MKMLIIIIMTIITACGQDFTMPTAEDLELEDDSYRYSYRIINQTTHDLDYTYEITENGSKSITSYGIKMGCSSSIIRTCRGVLTLYVTVNGIDGKIVGDFYLKKNSTITIILGNTTYIQIL